MDNMEEWKIFLECGSDFQTGRMGNVVVETTTTGAVAQRFFPLRRHRNAIFNIHHLVLEKIRILERKNCQWRS